MIRWLYDHYFLTSSVALYYMVLLGYGTYQVFYDVTAISAAVASAYGGLRGLPAAAAAIIKWRFSNDTGEDE